MVLIISVRLQLMIKSSKLQSKTKNDNICETTLVNICVWYHLYTHLKRDPTYKSCHNDQVPHTYRSGSYLFLCDKGVHQLGSYHNKILGNDIEVHKRISKTSFPFFTQYDTIT